MLAFQATEREYSSYCTDFLHPTTVGTLTHQTLDAPSTDVHLRYYKILYKDINRQETIHSDATLSVIKDFNKANFKAGWPQILPTSFRQDMRRLDSQSLLPHSVSRELDISQPESVDFHQNFNSSKHTVYCFFCHAKHKYRTRIKDKCDTIDSRRK